MFEIKKGVPLPKSRRGGVKYPFADMDVGDMFLVPCAPAERKQVQNSVGTCARNWVLRNNPEAKILARYHDDGVGVWRIK